MCTLIAASGTAGEESRRCHCGLAPSLRGVWQAKQRKYNIGHGGWPQLAKNSVMAMAVSHDVLYCASADMAIRAWVGILFLLSL